MERADANTAERMAVKDPVELSKVSLEIPAPPFFIVVKPYRPLAV